MSGSVPARKHSVAIVLRDAEGRFLAVRRSDDDDTLPGLWGLPAATARPGETEEFCAVRAGRDKLGVSIELGRRIGEDGNGSTRLVEYEATIVAGTPSVPQPVAGTSQYAALRFTDDPRLLVEAARQGSLCSRIWLRHLGLDWR